ncbi:hypothetical protein BDB01DRAFT_798028 [Pilobolus umbonatus]|nr:hypothetical protein BDB01DRAFT_798028 [Pilobolus umbonatus]
MSMHKDSRSEHGSPIPTQNQNPNMPYYTLDMFYKTLLSTSFHSSTEAIAFCRDLCSTHGFTVKQEQSTHKNIYVYCSREGLPDSHRNPKLNPQRNRHSQRCECRWRIVLYENTKSIWEFRKSQNADAFIHNHPLLNPDEVKKEWPREVSEKIFELARQRLPTNEIRQQVRELYPDISWDDRRFYNRLSEERQKMKQRDTITRAHRLVNLSAQICMVNAGSEDLSHYVESKLIALLEDTCKFASAASNSITHPLPVPFPVIGGTKVGEDKSPNLIHENIGLEKTPLDPKQDNHSEASDYKRPSIGSKKSFEALPKGYLAVGVPEHSYHVKMYSQNSAGDIRRAIFDMQRSVNTNTAMSHHLQYSVQGELSRRRSRATFSFDEDNHSMDLDTPPRKVNRQRLDNPLIDDEIDDMSSQSSPPGSQLVSHSVVSHNEIKMDPQQLVSHFNQSNMLEQQQHTPPAASDMFYNENSRHNSEGSMSLDGNNSFMSSRSNNYNEHVYSQNNHISTMPTNVSSSMNRPVQHPLQQQVVYNNNSFISRQSQQNETSDLELIQQPSQPMMDRPQSMTYGAPIHAPVRAHSISVSRGSDMQNRSVVYNTPYQENLNMMQNSGMEEPDARRKYYHQIRVNQTTPRTPSNLVSQSYNNITSSDNNPQVLSSYSPIPPQSLFPDPYMINEQMMQQQHYNIAYRPPSDSQHLYRRASGPN